MKTKLIKVDSANSNRVISSLPMPPFDCDLEIKDASKIQKIPLGEWPARAMVDKKQMWPWPEGLISSSKGYRNPPKRCLVSAEFSDKPATDVEVSFIPGKKLSNNNFTPFAEVEVLPGKEIYFKKDEAGYHYVKREDSCEIRFNDKTLCFNLAMNINGDMRRWQWIELKQEWRGPLSCAYTVGGHIYAGKIDRRISNEEAKDLQNTSFYQEHSVCAKAFIVIHSNGCLELNLHFANVQGYGRGDIAFGLPVMEMTSESFNCHCEEGKNISEDKNKTVWQFLDSTKIFLGERLGLGLIAVQDDAEPQFVDDSERGFVKGAGRSFKCILKQDAQTQLPSRLLASPEWYKKCSEFGVALPAEENNSFEDLRNISELAQNVFLRNIHSEGMSKGGVYRYLDKDEKGRYELSMDGNESSFIFRGAYMKSCGKLYKAAMESARCIGDIAVDHNYFNIHYHGDMPDWSLFSLIYLRFGGLVQAWQETGDPWHLENAEAVASRWIAVNRQNQPRKNMGRDGEPVEGILMLYDATGKDHYFVEAEKIALDVARSLFEDSFWRSGYGVGPYWGINAMPGQAWNGSHLLAGLAEFVARACPETSENYEFLLGKTCSMIRRLIQSIREDYDGFHRTSGSFVPRRYFLPAYIADDRGLIDDIVEIIKSIEENYKKTGKDFFKAGHHCAGYLDSPYVFLSLFNEHG